MKNSNVQSELVSVVVPVYNSADTIGKLVKELASENLGYRVEFVLVNDGSSDNSQKVCAALVEDTDLLITLINHSRNFGEHNAIMTGLRHAKGDYIVTMDDDLQNPPSEIGKLLRTLILEDHDLVYGVPIVKNHAKWRNLGSWSANLVADWVNDKPRGLYLSTFRVMRRFLAEEITRYKGPYPYVDGLVFQVSNRIGSVEVEHLPNSTRPSNYTLKKLASLWATILVNFSVKPLQISIFLGLAMAALGALGVIYVVTSYFLYGPDTSGWASMSVLLMAFTGAQLIMLGLIGEYVGRMFLDVSDKPQSVVRTTLRNENMPTHKETDAKNNVKSDKNYK